MRFGLLAARPDHGARRPLARSSALTPAPDRRRERGDPLSKHEIGGPASDAGLRRSSIACGLGFCGASADGGSWSNCIFLFGNFPTC